MNTVITGPWGTSSGGYLTVTHGSRSQISFDNWDVALAAAIATAKTMQGVKVNKVGGEWVVSWQTPVTYNPIPGTPSHPYPSYPYPTWWAGTNGDVA